MGDFRILYKFKLENLKVINHLRDLDIDLNYFKIDLRERCELDSTGS
jgi:hypothetical protein